MGRQNLRKQLGSGSKKRSASRVQSHSNNVCKTDWSVAKRHFYKRFALIMSSTFRYQAFVAVSGNLAVKVPIVDDVLSLHEREIHSTTHSVKTAYSSNFKRIGTTMLIWERRTRLWNWNLSGTLITRLTISRKCKRAARGGKSGWWSNDGREARGSGSSGYSYKLQFALNFFQCWSVHQQ